MSGRRSGHAEKDERAGEKERVRRESGYRGMKTAKFSKG